MSDSTKFRRLGNEYVAGLDSRFESSKTCNADSRVISRTRCVFVQSQFVIETERDGQFRKSRNANQIDETVLVRRRKRSLKSEQERCLIVRCLLCPREREARSQRFLFRIFASRICRKNEAIDVSVGFLASMYSLERSDTPPDSRGRASAGSRSCSIKSGM